MCVDKPPRGACFCCKCSQIFFFCNSYYINLMNLSLEKIRKRKVLREIEGEKVVKILRISVA